jgi:phosphopantetheinyl transferase (holo-ACP synthase)
VIGNDVVDLDDEEAQAHALHPRFDERVFGAVELARIRASGNPHQCRWLLWAAKESAYKLLRRTLPDLGFSPRAFVVRPSGTRAATVEARGHVVHVDYECGESFVHGVASYHGAPPTLAKIGMLSAQSEEPGVAARRLAAGVIANLLCVDARELVVDRTGRMPLLLRSGRPLPGTLSLSHHGRYVAFAWRGGALLSHGSRPRHADASMADGRDGSRAPRQDDPARDRARGSRRGESIGGGPRRPT